MESMRKLIDRVLWRLGYMRKDLAIQGEVEFKLHERPFVNLTLPRGAGRVYGHVDSGLPVLTYGDNPLFG
jgi:hypothetical protein